MWYFIKQSIFLVGLMFFMITTSMLILTIKIPVLELVLSILDLGLYSTAIVLIFYKEGQTAWKLRQSNDIERRNIIATGKDIPLKTAPEYKTWKGFIFGIVACVPMIVMLIIHAIVGTTGGGNGVGSACSLVHYIFYLPYYELRACLTADFIPSFGDYFGLLYAVALMAFLTFIGYYMGARKLQRAQNKVEDRKKEIESGKL